MLFKYLMFLPLHFLMIFLTYLFALPLGILSVIIKKDVLPGFLSWFHTHDDTLDGGQHQLHWDEKKGLSLGIQRAKWMWRNPAYGFRARVLGFSSEGSSTEIKKMEGKISKQKTKFKQVVEITSADGKKYFGYRTNRFWFGWRHPQSGGYHIYKCSIRRD